MRNAGRLKIDYYPLPGSEGVKLRSVLKYTQPASVIDPCVGHLPCILNGRLEFSNNFCGKCCSYGNKHRGKPCQHKLESKSPVKVPCSIHDTC
jgi:hypothetical protein